MSLVFFKRGGARLAFSKEFYQILKVNRTKTNKTIAGNFQISFSQSCEVGKYPHFIDKDNRNREVQVVQGHTANKQNS